MLIVNLKFFGSFFGCVNTCSRFTVRGLFPHLHRRSPISWVFFSFVIVLHCLFIRWTFSGSPMPVVITETLLASLKPHALLNHVENPYEDTACGFANISLVNFRPEAIWIFSVVTRRMYMHRLIDNEHWGSVCFMSNARRTSPHPICLEVLIFHIPELDALGFASSSLFRLPLMQLPSNYVEMLLDRWLSWRKARFEVNYIVYRFVFTFMDRVISHGNEMLWGLSMKRRKQFRWPLPFGKRWENHTVPSVPSTYILSISSSKQCFPIPRTTSFTSKGPSYFYE